MYTVFQPLSDSSALSPYFKDSDKKPNIVFVIVESLSSELIGENGKQTGQLMPFLDSLSQESLFFPNTLSTAERTHNVLPATLCSLPNSVDGTVFQQIEYPNHWSLMSLLKKDYFSRFYCGVKMEFINMQGFMRFQKTDLLSEKWSEENRKDSARIKASWGFPDECIYRQSEQDLEEIKTNKALFDVFLTISSHDP
ncbi:MAG: LTA synthase family protein, partial [Fluviicola sp.]